MAPIDRENLSRAGGNLSVDPAETPMLEALPADESSEEELLELGPRWRQVENAFGWVAIGVSSLMVGLGCRLVTVLLTAVIGNVFLLIALVPNLIVGVGSLILFFGQLFCLRVPAGTRARPAAAFSLLGRVIAY
jgi:hypothetical protein